MIEPAYFPTAYEMDKYFSQSFSSLLYFLPNAEVQMARANEHFLHHKQTKLRTTLAELPPEFSQSNPQYEAFQRLMKSARSVADVSRFSTDILFQNASLLSFDLALLQNKGIYPAQPKLKEVSLKTMHKDVAINLISKMFVLTTAEEQRRRLARMIYRCLFHVCNNLHMEDEMRVLEITNFSQYHMDDITDAILHSVEGEESMSVTLNVIRHGTDHKIYSELHNGDTSKTSSFITNKKETGRYFIPSMTLIRSVLWCKHIFLSSDTRDPVKFLPFLTDRQGLNQPQIVGLHSEKIHPMGMPIRGLFEINSADFRDATSLGFQLHDAYHADILSIIPQEALAFIGRIYSYAQHMFGFFQFMQQTTPDSNIAKQFLYYLSSIKLPHGLLCKIQKQNIATELLPLLLRLKYNSDFLPTLMTLSKEVCHRLGDGHELLSMRHYYRTIENLVLQCFYLPLYWMFLDRPFGQKLPCRGEEHRAGISRAYLRLFFAFMNSVDESLLSEIRQFMFDIAPQYTLYPARGKFAKIWRQEAKKALKASSNSILDYPMAHVFM
tara:strand:+ start:22061 stop:23713 length:1653 start_codon:yes stop_codon:yes gene_type:complete